MENLQEIVALAKRRGFIYPGSEIYGGFRGFWDYGPLGVELKNNIKREWWKTMVYSREDVVGVDTAIVMSPKVWEASGHTEAFTDPLVECKVCHKRFRADKQEEITLHEKEHGEKVIWTKPKKFNLLTEVLLGTTEPKQKAYLRGEITQGVFVNFANVIQSTRVKIPFGIAQIGKAFRNEITPGNFTYRSREFEQMELEYFVRPDEKESKKTFEALKQLRRQWYVSLGMKENKLRFREHKADERAHYARFAEDIEYEAPFGWSEFEGIHHRGDYDLKNHRLKYKDPDTNEEYTPLVIETSGGVDRSALFFLMDAYSKEEKRVVLKLHPKLAPVKVAVFPLLANKDKLVKKARQVFDKLKLSLRSTWDERGNIGKRYFSQDEAGTPFCVTIDFETLDNDSVTVRDRDTTAQVRVGVAKLEEYLGKRLGSSV
ncbi:glycine--tRNA ligase [Microgenomates group bacterium RIFCSPLOWO2_01_FULL_46_13]|nr:MAG: glycine--tRNA ligase [Microgenomates group bacterium RIFCSPHIGHO2_01_FULL_45_11]OGV94600.1 MAG: glycine--tRNA ligase [Microgenomates group bacterium RIFCSPLOWO2_01_FULL_46_13]